jgi:hypothetical protein
MNIACPLLFFFLFTSAFAQSTQPLSDTTFLHGAILNSVKVYETSLGHQSILHNGPEYAEPSRTDNINHPFFLSDDWLIGTVHYDGEYFTDVPLLYDITTDKLVTESQNASQLELLTDRLNEFTIDNHHFIKIKAGQNGLSKSGFYDVLYEGERRVIASRSKSNEEKIVDQSLQKLFKEKNRYFIVKDGVYSPVNNQSAIFKVLNDRKTELKKYMKKEHLSFKINREKTLAAVAAYYDTLKQGIQ